MGDFIGFTFGGVHTSSLGITRVSGGDRYDESLHPEINDTTAEVPGMDGNYYFGSNYGPGKIDLELAFDSLTEAQFRKLRQVFGVKTQKELIFDERPYKKYIAKIESPIELSYVCFDEPKKSIGAERDGVRRDRENDQEYVAAGAIEDSFTVPAGQTVSFTLTRTPSGEVTVTSEIEFTHEEETLTYVFDNSSGETDVAVVISYNAEEIPFEAAWEQVTPYVRDYSQTERIYKGEGKISFVCYFPFAKSVYKQIPSGQEESDWAISSGILTATAYQNIDTYNSETGVINIYNAGDIDTGFRLYIPAAALNNTITLNYKEDGINITASLVIKPVTLQTGDIGVLVDTTNELVVGVSQFNTLLSGNAKYTTSGNLYNEFIDSGYFFHFKPNLMANESILQITNGASGIEIFYDYLYF